MNMCSLDSFKILGVTLALLIPASSARAEEKYYMAVFASQGTPNLPRFAHTFAVFIKADAEQSGKDNKLETHCISWLPETLDVEPLRVKPERGKNLSLRETLEWARKNRFRVTMWGPFQIKKELYDR